MRLLLIRRGVFTAAALALASVAGGVDAAACGTPRDAPPADRALPAVDAGVVAGCAISTEEIGGARLLDVRHRGGGLREALPGAAAFDLAAAPPFGASERAVLVGDAADVRMLLGHCARLHAEGYANVRVLAGGFEAWRRTMKLADAAPERFAVPVAAAALERRAAAARNVLVFDAGTDAALQHLGMPANVARAGEAPAATARRIAADLARRRVRPGIDPITVVLADRRAVNAWRDAWNATAYPDPQFYIGTNEQFHGDVARSARIAAERGKPLPGPCDR